MAKAVKTSKPDKREKLVMFNIKLAPSEKKLFIKKARICTGGNLSQLFREGAKRLPSRKLAA